MKTPEVLPTNVSTFHLDVWPVDFPISMMVSYLSSYKMGFLSL